MALILLSSVLWDDESSSMLSSIVTILHSLTLYCSDLDRVMESGLVSMSMIFFLQNSIKTQNRVHARRTELFR